MNRCQSTIALPVRCSPVPVGWAPTDVVPEWVGRLTDVHGWTGRYGCAGWLTDVCTNPGRLRDDLRIPSPGHRRFTVVALPVAVWVFASVGTAYAVLPTLLAGQAHSLPIGFSALLTVLTLGCGFLIPSVARRIDRPGAARIAALALALVTAGMVLAASTLTLWIALIAAAVLGAGNGIGLVAGLQEVERIAEPRDLAGLTAVCCSVCYIGFGLPALLALLNQSTGLGYPVMLVAGAAVALLCLAVVLRNYREKIETH